MMKSMIVGIIGNPNSGKTTLFNQLTGSQQKTANWPGVTVEKKIGHIRSNNLDIEIVDLPGIYTLGLLENKTEDQKIAADFLENEKFDCIINILDSTNLERNLYLTLQLLEKKIPLVVILNMDDIALKKGIDINAQSLSEKIGCRVLKISSNKPSDVKRVKNILFEKEIKKSLSELYYDNHFSESDFLNKHTIEELINKRYSTIYQICKKIITSKNAKLNQNFSDKIDYIALNKYLGTPLSFLVFYLLFFLSIKVGGIFQNFFVAISQATFTDLPTALLSQWISSDNFLLTVINGIGYGLETIASFIPIIFFMYFFLHILDSSGYLSRVNLIFNKTMSAIGLHSNATFPLVVSLGCNVPAISATRILPNDSKIASIMMLPFISCSARFVIYALFCYIFFRENTSFVILLLYGIGILVSILTALLLKESNKKRSIRENLIEVPSYKFPHFRIAISSSFHKTKNFVKGISKTVVMLFMLLSVISQFTVQVNQQETPIINIVGQKLSCVFEPIGIDEKHWQLSVASIAGVFAKEVVIGTLSGLYGQSVDSDKNNITLKDVYQKYKSGVLETYENLIDLFSETKKDEDMDINLIDNMKDAFTNKLSAFCYMVFILLYFPCLSVYASIKKEIGRRFAIISVLYSTAIAYSLSVAIYQLLNPIINNETLDYQSSLLGVMGILLSMSFFRISIKSKVTLKK